jgi:uncharacterized protein
VELIRENRPGGLALRFEHPLRSPCRRIVCAIEDGAMAATTSAAVVQALFHVRARRFERSETNVLTGTLATLLEPLLTVRPEHVPEALVLFVSHPRLDPSDAFLAAAAIDADARVLVSADRAFAGIPGQRHVDPGSHELDELLRG